MNNPISAFALAILPLVGGIIGGDSLDMKSAVEELSPRVIHLDSGASASMSIFSGPPSTVTMRSGYVVLTPGASVGKHSTESYEEAVIVLQGRGEMRISGEDALPMHQLDVVYCPPHHEHDVVNTGADTLRYIWLVAKTD